MLWWTCGHPVLDVPVSGDPEQHQWCRERRDGDRRTESCCSDGKAGVCWRNKLTLGLNELQLLFYSSDQAFSHSFLLPALFLLCLSLSLFTLHFFSYLFLMHLWISVQRAPVQGKVNHRIGAVGCWERRCLLWNKWQCESGVWDYRQRLLTFFKGCSGFKSLYRVNLFMHSSLICKDYCKSLVVGWIFSMMDVCLLHIYSRSVVSGVSLCFHSHSTQSQLFRNPRKEWFWHLLTLFITGSKDLWAGHKCHVTNDSRAAGKWDWVNSVWWKMLFTIRLL